MRSFRQAFNVASMDAQVRLSDFRKYRTVLTASTRPILVDDAVQLAASAFQNACNFTYGPRKGREICSTDKYPLVLVLRKIASNVQDVVTAIPSDRNRVVDVLLQFLSEEVPHRVYRLDLKAFFESIDTEAMLAELSSLGVTRETHRLLKVVLEVHQATGRTGIPAGLSISSPLAEAVMQRFDTFVRTHSHVAYAARFVDDIIIVTNGREDSLAFSEALRQKLPSGTSFNTKKTTIVDVGPKKQLAAVYTAFPYLGYQFQVHDEVITPKITTRRVHVDLAPRTFARYRTKLSKAFRTFVRDLKFADLSDRIHYLTSNYRLYDPRVGRKRLAGIFHNHPFLTAFPGSSLHGLDKTLRLLVLSSPMLRAASGVQLTSVQRSQLLQRSFVRGHQQREYYSFSVRSLARIKRCWFDG